MLVEQALDRAYRTLKFAEKHLARFLAASVNHCAASLLQLCDYPLQVANSADEVVLNQSVQRAVCQVNWVQGSSRTGGKGLRSLHRLLLILLTTLTYSLGSLVVLLRVHCQALHRRGVRRYAHAWL